MKLDVALTAASLSALMFANVNGYELVFQLAAISMLASAATASLIRDFRPSRLTFFEASTLLAIFLSIATVPFTGNDYVAAYTVLFLLTVVSIGLICRSLQFEELILAASVSYYVGLFAILVIDGPSLLKALAGNPLTRWENRLAPLGTHPNLAGLIYLGGVLILLTRFQYALRVERAAILVCISICFLVDLGASARGALVSLVIAGGFLTIRNIGSFKKYGLSITLVGLTFAFVVLIVFPNEIWNYISTMFELNSTTRGLDSGGTGRVDLWRQGLDLIFGRDWQMLFGSGLRSSSPDAIGFSTESSFITIFIESGLLAGTLQIAAIITTLLKKDFDIPSKYHLIAKSIVIFFLIQSFFNRYLIAIGNPFSMFFLILVVKLSLERKKTLSAYSGDKIRVSSSNLRTGRSS
ncbi:hypothetical protein I6F18_08060 [Bradyrhizobium sp. NBAIM32]|uniref:O-antigen ligase family protein n=1 Tax=Bradyrhizobium sp. NBAIM32 TaxID=2793809 RepID=UPI001CD6F630|nr:hypothetical protein [Bradyrhizobium sp. NBAIM32]MCA1539908.1 hypothetical protein [Bradyrhizobium sp. NBAIM32]